MLLIPPSPLSQTVTPSRTPPRAWRTLWTAPKTFHSVFHSRDGIRLVKLNSDKTHYIVFCSTHKRMTSNNTLYINNTPLVQTHSSKFLGVLIDSHLTWKDHIMLVTKKVSKNIGVIARIKHCLPHKILLSLYYTLIFPYFSYCNIIWGSNYKTHLSNLFILQKRAIRLICNLPRFSSTKASFFKLNLLTLNNINKYQMLLFMFRYHHSLLPKSITIHFLSIYGIYIAPLQGNYSEALPTPFKQALRFMAITLDFPTTIEATMPE